MSKYVVDTCILVNANQDMGEAFPIVKLLITLLNGHEICLDSEGEILKEYENNGLYEGFSGEWYKNMQRSARITYVKKTIGRKPKNELLRMRFDPDDIKFVATAHVCGKRIISNDTDYNEEIINYLLEKMEIRVFYSCSRLD